jgi:hypothetical protein
MVSVAVEAVMVMMVEMVVVVVVNERNGIKHGITKGDKGTKECQKDGTGRTDGWIDKRVDTRTNGQKRTSGIFSGCTFLM